MADLCPNVPEEVLDVLADEEVVHDCLTVLLQNLLELIDVVVLQMQTRPVNDLIFFLRRLAILSLLFVYREQHSERKESRPSPHLIIRTPTNIPMQPT
jgi:hypothetical protein